MCGARAQLAQMVPKMRTIRTRVVGNPLSVSGNCKCGRNWQMERRLVGRISLHVLLGEVVSSELELLKTSYQSSLSLVLLLLLHFSE